MSADCWTVQQATVPEVLLCRELATTEALKKLSHSACQMETSVPSAAASSLPKNMPVHGLTPAAVRDVLQGGSPGQFSARRDGWSDNDDKCCAGAGCSTGDKASPDSAGPAHSMEANALLWAVKNLWFGVEQDMTSYAYTVCLSRFLAVKSGTLIILFI